MAIVKPTLTVCITSLGANKTAYKKAQVNVKSLTRYFDVELDQRILANDIFESRSVQDRINSLSLALGSGDVALAYSGGFNAVELLPEIAELKSNLKSCFVGYSDNTILVNALAKLGKCKTFYGPMYESYVTELVNKGQAAKQLSDLVNNTATQFDIQGSTVVKSGLMRGKIWGGNNYTFSLLQGTAFAPDFNEPFILFMEGETILKSNTYVWRDFIRNIDSIMLLPGSQQNITGLVIGKFPAGFSVKKNELEQFIEARSWLKNLPLVVDFPCGHTRRSLYLPIGQDLELSALKNQTVKLTTYTV